MKESLEELELFIAQLLRRGVIIAGVLILIGWAFQIDFSHDVFEQFKTYQEITLVETLTRLWQNQEWAHLTAYIGLIVLISLPILRVVATGIIFIKQKNFVMVSLVATVLFGLLLSITLGFTI